MPTNAPKTTAKSETKSETTRDRALAEAGGLLQEFGYNGFSFQHVADRIGIKKPSLYEHFGSKEEMGRELIEDYRKSFARWAETLEFLEPKEKLEGLFELFFKFGSKAGKFCPMSALIADFNSLPIKMRKPLNQMYEFQRDWLKTVIEDGQKKKMFRRDLSSEQLAGLVISLGIGSQLVARVTEEPEHLRKTKAQVIALLHIV